MNKHVCRFCNKEFDDDPHSLDHCKAEFKVGTVIRIYWFCCYDHLKKAMWDHLTYIDV